MMIRTKTLIVLGTLLTFAWAASVWAIPDERAAYPSGYRTWVHVRSALIDPKSATAGRFGGIHHIYANEKAVEGYRTGHFPDGSVIVFDLLETRESSGMTQEGPRKFIDVMTRDGQGYAETGGWDFEEFSGDNQTDPALTAQGKKDCYACHARQQNHDSVFSTFRK